MKMVFYPALFSIFFAEIVQAQDFTRFFADSVPKPSAEAKALTRNLLDEGVFYVESVDIRVHVEEGIVYTDPVNETDEKGRSCEVLIFDTTNSPRAKYNQVGIGKRAYWLEAKITRLESSFGAFEDYLPESGELKNAKVSDISLLCPDATYSYGITCDALKCAPAFHPSFLRPQEKEGIMDISTVLNLGRLEAVEHLKWYLHADLREAKKNKDAEKEKACEDALKTLEEIAAGNVKVENAKLADYELRVKRNAAGLLEEASITNGRKGFSRVIKNTFYKDGYPKPDFNIKTLEETTRHDKAPPFGICAKEERGKIILETDLEWSGYLYNNAITGDFFRNPLIGVNGSHDFNAETVGQILSNGNSIEVEVLDKQGARRKFKFRRLTPAESMTADAIKDFEYPSEKLFE